MPEGRLIKKKIADNERLNSMPIEARLLYDRLILFCDKEGRHIANPRLILSRYFPLDDYSVVEVGAWLQGLHDAKKNGVGLIELYEVEKVKYLWLPGFLGEQSKSWLHFTRGKEADSTIPPPPGWKPEKAMPPSTRKNLGRPQDDPDPDKYIRGKGGHMVKR